MTITAMISTVPAITPITMPAIAPSLSERLLEEPEVDCWTWVVVELRLVREDMAG